MSWRLGRVWHRLRCVRHGHALRCTSLGHCCTRCGLAWELLP